MRAVFMDPRKNQYCTKEKDPLNYIDRGNEV